MGRVALGALAAVVLAFPLLACCYFGGGGAAAPAPLAPIAPSPVPAPAPVPSVAAVLPPLSRPLVGGVARTFGSGQLVADVPTTAPAGRPVAAEPGIPGPLAESSLELEDEGVYLDVVDLPCVVTHDLETEIVRELSRRHPEAGAFTTRAIAVADPTLTVVEIGPSVSFRASDNGRVIGWFAVDLGSHVVLARLATWDLAPGVDDLATREVRRALGESVIGTLRRGPWTWTAILAGPTYGDLYHSITAPVGWTLRTSGCCNEDPPYVTRFRESVIPLRALGEPPRARVTARWGTCPAGTPARPGTMFGAPMTWSRTTTGLCWTEIPPDGALELGVSWHLRGATEADLDEAVAIAATASHDD